MGEYRVKSGKQREEGEAVAIFAWGLQQFGVVVWERTSTPHGDRLENHLRQFVQS